MSILVDVREHHGSLAAGDGGGLLMAAGKQEAVGKSLEGIKEGFKVRAGIKLESGWSDCAITKSLLSCFMFMWMGSNSNGSNGLGRREASTSSSAC